MVGVVNTLKSPKFHMRFNAVNIFVWLILLPPTILLWKESIVYLVFMSWYALFSSSIAGYVSARSEMHVDPESESP